eukprot:5832717-Amphidinium_carterae.1
MERRMALKLNQKARSFVALTTSSCTEKPTSQKIIRNKGKEKQTSQCSSNHFSCVLTTTSSTELHKHPCQTCLAFHHMYLKQETCSSRRHANAQGVRSGTDDSVNLMRGNHTTLPHLLAMCHFWKFFSAKEISTKPISQLQQFPKTVMHSDQE